MVKVNDVESKDVNDIIKIVREYISNNIDSEKTQFIKLCSEQSQFDVAIHYLLEVLPLLKKKKLMVDEQKKLEPYKQIISIYTDMNREEK